MKKLELTGPAFYSFCFLAAVLLLAMTPAISLASNIFAEDVGFFPCSIACWDPDGESSPDAVRAATFFVGDSVQWGHAALSGNTFTITASTTQGDYQGHTCPEPGGLNALLTFHEDTYNRTFTLVQDCFYRDTNHPPNPSQNYLGDQGVVHIVSTTGPSPYWLMPVNLLMAPSAAQAFTAFYADPGLYTNLSDSSLALKGVGFSRTETVHYNPVSNTFTLQGVGGSCSPGDSATLTDSYVTLDCSQSSVLTSGTFLQVTYNLTPQPPLSGHTYQLILSAMELGGTTATKTLGTLAVSRTPNVNSSSPSNPTTPVGTLQTFTVAYSDPDGWPDIAAVNFYLSGNGGVHIESLNYYVAPNLFIMKDSNDSCSPGQAKTLSSGYLTFNCATSTVSGSGTNLTINYKLTPQAPSSGIQYLILNTVSDQEGLAFAALGGNWQIP